MTDKQQTLYRFFDDQDRLLYVGITNTWYQRFHQHEKEAGWFAHVVRATFEKFPDRESVMAAETAAILSETPIYNKQQNPDYESPTDHFQRIKYAIFAKSQLDELHTPVFDQILAYLVHYKLPKKSAKYAAMLWFSSYYQAQNSGFECRNCEALFHHRMYSQLARDAWEEYNAAN